MEKLNTNNKRRILFTGGGSSGHVVPNIALIEKCREDDWDIHYIGSKTGIERQLINHIAIPYYPISSGKLRRYFSWRHFSDPFKVAYGFLQSFCLLRKLKPDLVFSKGGFVALPVVFAAWLNRIPVIAHESDIMPGLANRLSFPFVNHICVTFEAGRKYFKNQKKVSVTGTPIRSSLLNGNDTKGRALCGFSNDKTILLIVGGGLGAEKINQTIRKLIPQVLTEFNIVHLCGEGKVDAQFEHIPGYKQFDYANETMPDLMACADLVISRAGANTVYELLALKKPHIFIPLSRQVSNGHQVANANYFAKKGVSFVLEQEQLTADSLLAAIHHLKENSHIFTAKLEQLQIQSGTNIIYQVILGCADLR